MENVAKFTCENLLQVLRQRFASFQYAMSRGKVKGVKVEEGVQRSPAGRSKLTETLELLKSLE